MEVEEKSAEWMTMEEITSVSLAIKKILLATDGLVASVKATKYAVALARKLNAEILGVYVLTIVIISKRLIRQCMETSPLPSDNYLDWSFCSFSTLL